MSTNKYKWFIFGAASIVISGCSVGSKTNLNLGIADAFRKSRNCLFKKKMSYQTPAAAANFGYASSHNSSVPVDSGMAVVVAAEPAPSACGCNNAVSAPVSEFYMPVAASQETVEIDADDTLPATLPLEPAQDDLDLENALPAPLELTDPIEAPISTSPPTLEVTPDNSEEEGVIETLDSAAIELEQQNDALEATPQKIETSILDTALKPLRPLKTQTPTSAGESVVEQRSKMLTLTARPVQSHQLAESQGNQSHKVEMQQVTHKRHFREQNTLRPLHQKFGARPLEHTAEAPGPLKFKPLPVMKKEPVKLKNLENNTGAPSLNRNAVETQEQSSKMQPLSTPAQELKAEPDEESVIKIARLPILRAESTSSAAIGSLRNFTNVRDLDPGFDKNYNARKEAETAALKTIQISSDNVSGSIDDLNIER